jgi:hypothetical protein
MFKTVISISIISNTAARARNRNADSNKADADVPPLNPAEEQMHVLSLHLRWNSCPSSVRAATRLIERAMRLPPLVCARTLLIEAVLFEVRAGGAQHAPARARSAPHHLCWVRQGHHR